MPNWSEEIFVISKIKNTVPWTYVLNDLNGEEIIGTFYENELQGTKQNKFRIDKIIKRKGDKLYVKWKGYNISFNINGDINVKVDLSNYATKTDVKNITHIVTSSFALKVNLANLKAEVDKLDVDKLATVPIDLSKLSNVGKNDVVKKTDYNKLVAKVDNIDTSGLVKRTDYNTK